MDGFYVKCADDDCFFDTIKHARSWAVEMVKLNGIEAKIYRADWNTREIRELYDTVPVEEGAIAPMQLTFRGDSDDIRMIFSGDKEILDVSGYEKDFERSVEIKRGTEGFRVVYHYDGCWSMSVRQLDEDIPIPKWLKLVKVEMGDWGGYSADLTIEVPEDVEIKQVGNDEEEWK